MQYSTTSSFKVVANGRTGYSFQPDRGIIQGDLLSPCIFIVGPEYVEIFWYGTKLTKETRNYSYLMLQMANHFLHDNKKATRNVKYILNHYCRVSKQLVNYHKSKIQLANGTNNADERELRISYK